MNVKKKRLFFALLLSITSVYIVLLSNEKLPLTSEQTVYLKTCKNRVAKRHNKSIWTMVSEGSGYLLSSLKLIKSIRLNTKRRDYDTFLLEIAEKRLNETTRRLVKQAGWRICTVDGIPLRKGTRNGTIDRFVDQFSKLRLWNFVELESILYLDADTLVVLFGILSYLFYSNKFIK
jgi:alpha-N-acetylglucosamine transferase